MKEIEKLKEELKILKQIKNDTGSASAAAKMISIKQKIKIIELEQENRVMFEALEGIKRNHYAPKYMYEIAYKAINSIHTKRYDEVQNKPTYKPQLYDRDTDSLDYGKYMVVRSDGKIHMEVYNGTGFAYNDKVITHYYLPKIK